MTNIKLIGVIALKVLLQACSGSIVLGVPPSDDMPRYTINNINVPHEPDYVTREVEINKIEHTYTMEHTIRGIL